MKSEKQPILIPSARQVEWADCEIGVIIHFDLTSFAPEYTVAKRAGAVSPGIFNPDRLDTDQWLACAKAARAKYAVLTASHSSGFSLAPSAISDFTIANSPYKNGKGDVVAEFIASCKKYDIRPGLYFPVAWCKDAERMTAQLTELWTRYGELFEIWFDGGCRPIEQGGPDIATLIKTLQPNAVAFQMPQGLSNGIRWVGNERGVAPEDCWATIVSDREAFDGCTEAMRGGTPYGNVWRPAEADMPGRIAGKTYMNGWFWREGEDENVLKGEELFDRYLTSVGRNCNLLIGMAIDRHGLLPQADAEALRDLGTMLADAFDTPLAQYEGDLHAKEYHLSAPEGKTARYLVVMEDITKGERILHYRLGCGIEGHCIGHKRIIPLPVGTQEVEFVIKLCKDTPALRGVWLY